MVRILKRNDWLVGVSIDGPQEFHDRYRRNKQGQPSFVKVMKGIHLLNKYGVDWNAMAVVNNLNADYPLEFYNFFKEIGCRYIQFTPIVERIFRHNDGRLLATIGEDTPELMEFSVTPEQWGNFLCTILRNGCIMMSVSITYSYLTQLWRIGSVKIQAYAQWENVRACRGNGV